MKLIEKRKEYINQRLEKELGPNYIFNGSRISNEGELLTKVSMYEKLIIIGIYSHAINKIQREDDLN